jgi:hypothetical protein
MQRDSMQSRLIALTVFEVATAFLCLANSTTALNN